ncbi:amidohydrolase family protein [Paraburkholderia sp.]|uniref:amidohydrolase family protein n=1 Tax=Paraburkholderia sp. TaxID=1926495 RepID=UPI0039E5B076
MKIIDAQVHVWKADSPERPWDPVARTRLHEFAAYRAEPLSYEELLGEMDKAGVYGAILVPPYWEGDRVDYALEAAKAYPNRFAVMGHIPTEERAGRQVLDNWTSQPGMLGMRQTFAREDRRARLVDGSCEWLWQEASRLGIPVMIHAPTAIDELCQIAGRHPDLRLILDHMGILIHTTDDAIEPFINQSLRLAAYPNVAIKLSAAPTYSSESYPYRNIHVYLNRLIDAFGPRRCFWGTDMTRLPCTYRQAVTMFTEELPFLNETDKEWIMGRGLSEWLGWNA